MTAPVDIDISEYAIAFQRDGYFVRDGVVSDEDVQRLRVAVDAIPNGEEVRLSGRVNRPPVSGAGEQRGKDAQSRYPGWCAGVTQPSKREPLPMPPPLAVTLSHLGCSRKPA